MADPARRLASGFSRRGPLFWLLVAAGISGFEAAAFILVARSEGVLWISGGVGLFQNYGLAANLLANAVFPYLVHRYREEIGKIVRANASDRETATDVELSKLEAMLKGEGRFVGTLYIFAFIGLLFWLSNTSIHLSGAAATHWGHKVFDSPDHVGMFLLNRMNNFYTWVILLPLCANLLLWPTLQIRNILRAAMEQGTINFDPLHTDRAGGYAALENAKTMFNMILAIVYLDVSLHTGTFMTAHFDHISAYIAATVVLLFGNFIIFRDVDARVKSMRRDALETHRRRVYENDRLSFEILKFAYETPQPRWLANLLIKGVPVALSLAVKIAPLLPSYIRGV